MGLPLSKSPKKDLERAVATELGQILIGFARLDVNLGLACAWKGEGTELERLSETLDERFCVRLRFLETAVAERYPSGPSREAYEDWIADAHGVREQRNRIVHSRWGFTHDGNIFSIAGLPTSIKQTEQRFTIEQLVAIHAGIESLTSRLAKLMKSWPI